MLRGFFIASTTIVSILFFSVSFTTASAALLYIDPNEVTIQRGDTMTVALRIDTDEGECINTVDAVINYDPAIKIIDVSRGRSILNIWVEDPIINEEKRTVTFAGGIPGGYCGRIPGDPSLTNIILELVLRSPGFSIRSESSGGARIWVDPISQVLLHDGFGTVAPLRFEELQVNLSESAAPTLTDTWRDEITADTELPADFPIELTHDEVAFSGDYFITFNSIDKQSGIDHYEIIEEPIRDFYSFKWGRGDAPWRAIESPYVLKDQTLNSTIRVKAVDKAGNERISVLVPDPAYRSISHDRLITYGIIMGVVALLIYLTIFAILKRRRRIHDGDTTTYEN